MNPVLRSHQTSAGTVLVYSTREREAEHESAVHADLGRRLARLLGMDFGGTHQSGARYPGRIYLLPTDTIIGEDHAMRLGLRSEADLFGGAAPHAFLPTKAITHPLFGTDATAPAGWSHAFGRLVSQAVLDGITVFSLRDAQRAGERMLEHGPLRLKPVLATAGRGQIKISSPGALREAIARLDANHLARFGLVLEENLEDVQTFSVGKVRVGHQLVTYVGTQSLTPDNRGEMVYGGSELLVVPGDFDRLLALPLGEDSRVAIAKARTYDDAATACYPGLLASRRNYDIALGRNQAGAPCCGVLEQSWRTGGASAAEIAAIEAFRADPQLEAVHAATVERFGTNTPEPADAQRLYRGSDSEVGPMSKYVTVRPYGRPRDHAAAPDAPPRAGNGNPTTTTA